MPHACNPVDMILSLRARLSPKAKHHASGQPKHDATGNKWSNIKQQENKAHKNALVFSCQCSVVRTHHNQILSNHQDGRGLLHQATGWEKVPTVE